MQGDKKRQTLVAGILGPEKEKGEGDEPSLSDLDAIAMDLVDAINTDDIAGVKEALKAFVYSCGAEGEDTGGG